MHRNRDFSISLGILILIAVLYALMCSLTPLALDDWSFMAAWQEVNGDKPLSLSTLIDFWKEIRLYDNGRLANTLSPLSTMFSPWKDLFPVVTGLMVSLIVAFTAYFSFSTPIKSSHGSLTSFRYQWLAPLKLSLVWMAIFFMLPWRNGLFIADYSLNYIWTCAITMTFMALVINCENSHWSVLTFILSLVLAFFAGAWHEGFAVATLAGFLLYTIIRGIGRDGKRFSVQWYLIGVFYAAVTLTFCLSPGLLHRSSKEFAMAPLGSNIFKLFFDFLPVLLCLLLLFLNWVLPGFRKYIWEAWRNPLFVIASGISFTGILLSLLFTHQPRSAFWPDIMAIIMIMILTRPLWNKLTVSRFNPYFTVLAISCCLVPMVYILVWQRKLLSESDSIIADMRSSESGTVFKDIIRAEDLPFITMKMTNQGAWITEFHYSSLGKYFNKPYPAVVPANLENINIDILERTSDSEVIKSGDSFLIPHAVDISTIPLEVTLNNGKQIEAIALMLPFMPSDGTPMTYINIYKIPTADISEIKFYGQ